MDIFTPIHIYADLESPKFGSVRDPARVTQAPQAPEEVDVPLRPGRDPYFECPRKFLSYIFC